MVKGERKSGVDILFFVGTIISFVLAGYIIWDRGVKSKITNVDSEEVNRLKDEISKLLTEFNRVSNANINVLEDKIEDLKNIIKLADDKIIRLNSSVTDLNILMARCNSTIQPLELTQVPREPIVKLRIKPLSKKATLEEKKERINEMVSAGFSIEEIARVVNMSKGEVQLVLGLEKKLNNS